MRECTRVQDFEKNGYCLVPQLFSSEQLEPIVSIIESFHSSWQKDNQAFYQSRAINSAYLTADKYLDESQRLALFRLITSAPLVTQVSSLLGQAPGFMGSQLFFDPVDPKRKNYWHRDPQYHLDLEQQKAALKGPEVLHCRIALTDEPGIEVIPGSHKAWDTQEQLDVRLELNGRNNHEDLEQGKRLPLFAGDVLFFSATMIHRGHYGMDRRVLDILYCAPEPDLLQFVRPDCLPTRDMWPKLSEHNPLTITRDLLNSAKV